MTFDEARTLIIGVIHETTNFLHRPDMAAQIEDTDADIAFGDIEMDSLVAMELCIELEDKTGVQVELGDLALYPSVNALAQHVSGQPKG